METSKMKNSFIPLLGGAMKGISQVVFIENVFTGLLMLAAFFIHSFSLGLITLGSAMIGTLVAAFAGGDKQLVHSGLFGFNSVLAGVGTFLFLDGSYKWIIALACAGIATIVTAAAMNITNHFEMPVLTFPFIIVTWFIISTSFRLGYADPGASILPQNVIDWSKNFGGTLDWHGLISGVGQVIFIDEMLPSLLFLLAIFIGSRKYGFYTIIGSAVGWLAAICFGGEVSLINLGLYNYNAVLTMIAVGAVFANNRKNAWITGIFAAILSVLITASLSTFLLPYGLPVLTMPFVLATLLIQSARKVFPAI